MLIVDSAVWVDHFRGDPSPESERLARGLRAEEDLAVLPIIVTEVLQGFRRDTQFRAARQLMTALPCLEPGIDTHVRAANLFRDLRKRGVTVRGAVDCLIAQTAIEFGAQLLSPDRDFAEIAKHSRLDVWTLG